MARQVLNGAVITGATTATGTVAGSTVLTVKGAASQTANITEWRDSTGTALLSVTSAGDLKLPTSDGTSDLIVYNSSDQVLFRVYGTGAAYIANRADVVPFTIYGKAGGQSASLFEIHDANDASVLYVTGAGGVRINSSSAAQNPLIIKGAASQTGDLQQWQDSSANLLIRITKDGSLQSSDAIAHGLGSSITSGVILTVGSGGNTGVIPLVVRGAASQIANLTEWRNSAGTTLTRIDVNGSIWAQTVVVDSADTAARIFFGSALDVSAFRSGVNTLRLDGTLEVNKSLNVGGDNLGKLYFGSVYDTNLYRSAANTLRTDDQFIANSRVSATDGTNAIDLATTGGLNYIQSGPYGSGGATDLWIGGMFGVGGEFMAMNASKVRIGSGTITFGGAEDTNLYRSAADTLRTDDSLVVSGNLFSVNAIVAGSTGGLGGVLNALSLGAGALVEVVRGAAGQTADLTQWQDSTGAALARVTSNGMLVEKQVVFTPTTVGWYRIIASGSAIAGGVIRLWASYDNATTDIEFQFNIGGYGTNGSIQQTRYSSYNQGVISQARISSDSGNNCYLDIYVRSAATPDSITVQGFGPWLQYAAFVSSPVVGATAGSTNVQTLILEHGFLTTSAVRVQAQRATSSVPLTITGMAGQTADIAQWQNSTGNPLLAVNASGTLLFGTAQDTNLYRSAADVLKTDDHLIVAGALEVQHGFGISLPHDSSFGIRFGTSLDTNLYRGAADVLTTDDTFVVGGDLITISEGAVLGTDAISGIRLGFAKKSGLNPVITAASTTPLQLGHWSTTTLRGGNIASGSFTPRLTLNTDGTISLGGGLVWNGDTNLYRAAADYLKTDDNLIVGSTLTVFGSNISQTATGYAGLIVNSLTSGNPYLTLRLDGADKGSIYYDRATDRLIFTSGATDWMTLTAAGRMGIGGTQSPYGNAVVSVNTMATTNPGIVVRGVASQTADLQQWQNSAGTALVNITAAGRMYLTHSIPLSFESATARNYICDQSLNSFVMLANGGFGLTPLTTGLPSVALKMTPEYGVGLELAYDDNAGTGARSLLIARYGNVGLQVSPYVAGDVGLIVKGQASQSAALQQWRNSGGTVLAAIRNDGMFLGPYLSAVTDTGPYVDMTSASTISVVNRTSAVNVIFRVTAMASQTGDLQRWQDSSNNPLLAVNASGTLLFGTAQDTNLYRAAANVLKTDDFFLAAGSIRTTGEYLQSDNETYVGGPLFFGPAGGAGPWDVKLYRVAADNLRSDDTVSVLTDLQVAINNTGKLYFGSAQDTNLYRVAANTLQTDDLFQVVRASAANGALGAYVVGDSVLRLAVQADGKLEWGNGGSAVDVNLYRAGADHLKTDDQFTVGSTLYFGNSDTNLYRSAADTLRTDDSLVVSGNLFSVNAIVAGSTGGLGGVLNALSPSAGQLVVVVRGAASQTADLTQWQNSAGSPLLSVNASGTLLFGSAQDTNLYRGAANVLATDDLLGLAKVAGTAADLGGSNVGDKIALYGGNYGIGIQASRLVAYVDAGAGFGVRQVSATGHASSGADLFTLHTDGKLYFGSALDTNLYRAAADTLKTDDNFIVAGNLTVNGSLTGSSLIGGGNLLANASFEHPTPFTAWTNPAGGTSKVSNADETGAANVFHGTHSRKLTIVDVSGLTDGFHWGGINYQVTGGMQYRGALTASAWLKATSGRIIGIRVARIKDGSIQYGGGAHDDATTLVTADGTWQRVVVTLTASAETATTDWGFELRVGFDGSGTMTNGDVCYVDAVQLEMGANPTGFAPKADEIQATDLAIGSAVKLVWATDTNLYRSAADTLKTDDAFRVGAYLQVTDVCFFEGTLNLGPPGSADANLYRASANVLKTDDDLYVVGAIYAGQGLSGQVGLGGLVSGLPGLVFGSAGDTNLYRAAADTLKTDDWFISGARALIQISSSSTVLTSALPVLEIQNTNSTLNALNGMAFKNAGGFYTAGIYTLPQTDATLNKGAHLTFATKTSDGASYLERLRLQADGDIQLSQDAGKLLFGASGDTNLYRAASNYLRTDGNFQVGRWLAVDKADVGGKLTFGSGEDTNLYRSAANTLATDDHFNVVTAGTDGVVLGAGAGGWFAYRIFANTGGVTNVGLGVRGVASQTADLTQWQDNTQAVMARITAVGQLQFGAGASGDTNLYRSAADTLKTDDTFYAVGDVVARVGAAGQVGIGSFGPSGTPGVVFGSSADTNLYRYGADILKTDDYFYSAVGISANIGTANAAHLGFTGPSTAGPGVVFGSAADTNLYRSAADVLKTDDLFDASIAGLRTKHEGTATPTGGNSGEIRAGSSKLWVQDAGTWREIPAGYASTVKWMTD